jgi:hypothetical protein
LKDALNRINLRNASLEIGKRNAGEAARVPPAQPLVSATKRRRETPAAATRADA